MIISSLACETLKPRLIWYLLPGQLTNMSENIGQAISHIDTVADRSMMSHHFFTEYDFGTRANMDSWNKVRR